MGRLVGAVVLFIATMLGWRVVNSPAVQRDAANSINNPTGNLIGNPGDSTSVAQSDLNTTQPLPQPRSTGFSSRVEPSPTPTITPTTPVNPNLPSPAPTPIPPNRGQLW